MRVELNREPPEQRPLREIILRGAGVEMITIRRGDTTIDPDAVAGVYLYLNAPDGPVLFGSLRRGGVRQLIEGLQELIR